MKEEFLHKWSNWWILHPQRKQLDDAFARELDAVIAHEVALRQPPVKKSVCGNCGTEVEPIILGEMCPFCNCDM